MSGYKIIFRRLLEQEIPEPLDEFLCNQAMGTGCKMDAIFEVFRCIRFRVQFRNDEIQIDKLDAFILTVILDQSPVPFQRIEGILIILSTLAPDFIRHVDVRERLKDDDRNNAMINGDVDHFNNIVEDDIRSPVIQGIVGTCHDKHDVRFLADRIFMEPDKHVSRGIAIYGLVDQLLLRYIRDKSEPRLVFCDAVTR